ncbi:hypothetical protein [Ferrimonas lipolytica]|uniref:Uncharacterized protein n=1 Tax=Ferrimonas lipolytica TaxID=2724191 RepID=A0A6H1UIC5_9GAMM|nr:hypothetical protein [Ferrimonas lipolytica]QIZ77966.1 hypothetical protein HER31_14320 [Ferrimonas lipolytica]
MPAINIALDQNLLQQLIRDGHLCVAQLSALDQQSKSALWQLCLECSCDNRFDNTEQQALHFKPYVENENRRTDT